MRQITDKAFEEAKLLYMQAYELHKLNQALPFPTEYEKTLLSATEALMKCYTLSMAKLGVVVLETTEEPKGQQ